MLSTLRRNLSMLDSEAMRQSLSHTTPGLDLAQLKSKPMTVLLSLPMSMVDVYFRWFRLVFNMALIALEREAGDPALFKKTPVLFLLDEFASLQKMRKFELSAGQMASFGVKLWVIIQHLSQIQAIYGERWDTFYANAGIRQFFGIHDPLTGEFVQKAMGLTAIRTENTSHVPRSGKTAANAGKSWSVQQVPLLTAEECGRFFARETGRQLILIPGSNPVVAERIDYFKTPETHGPAGRFYNKWFKNLYDDA